MSRNTHISIAHKINRVNREIQSQCPDVVSQMEKMEGLLKESMQIITESEKGIEEFQNRLISARRMKDFYEKELERIYYLISLKAPNQSKIQNPKSKIA